jgi:hypothetical protein
VERAGAKEHLILHSQDKDMDEERNEGEVCRNAGDSDGRKEKGDAKCLSPLLPKSKETELAKSPSTSQGDQALYACVNERGA